jgi:hypothetical protein
MIGCWKPIVLFTRRSSASILRLGLLLITHTHTHTHTHIAVENPFHYIQREREREREREICVSTHTCVYTVKHRGALTFENFCQDVVVSYSWLTKLNHTTVQ